MISIWPLNFIISPISWLNFSHWTCLILEEVDVLLGMSAGFPMSIACSGLPSFTSHLLTSWQPAWELIPSYAFFWSRRGTRIPTLCQSQSDYQFKKVLDSSVSKLDDMNNFETIFTKYQDFLATCLNLIKKKGTCKMYYLFDVDVNYQAVCMQIWQKYPPPRKTVMSPLHTNMDMYFNSGLMATSTAVNQSCCDFQPSISITPTLVYK